jgi:hypothetical protein
VFIVVRADHLDFEKRCARRLSHRTSGVKRGWWDLSLAMIFTIVTSGRAC